MRRSERRRHKRVKRNLIVRFRVRSKKTDDLPPEDWPMGIIHNLSAEGALFKYNKKMELDSIVELMVKFPVSRTPIDCVGKVVRIEAAEDAEVFFIAVNFTEINEEAKEKINRFAKDFTAD